MADAYAALDSLRHMLTLRRASLLEKMANGMEKEDDYRVHVGRCKELKATIDSIGDQIKSINGGDVDDEPKPIAKT